MNNSWLQCHGDRLECSPIVNKNSSLGNASCRSVFLAQFFHSSTENVSKRHEITTNVLVWINKISSPVSKTAQNTPKHSNLASLSHLPEYGDANAFSDAAAYTPIAQLRLQLRLRVNFYGKRASMQPQSAFLACFNGFVIARVKLSSSLPSEL